MIKIKEKSQLKIRVKNINKNSLFKYKSARKNKMNNRKIKLIMFTNKQRIKKHIKKYNSLHKKQ
jgi:hypothetical protein